jgi:enoyl-CoA hydratase/carnithine racemase
MITYHISGFTARIRLDRASARNALTAEGWHALAQAIAAVTSSEARVLLLLSAVPGSFCAGSDLNELADLAGNASDRAAFRQMMREAMDPLRTLAIPTIAAIEGDCFGAGVALALACDIRIAGERARFAVTPAKLGISYPIEDVARLVAAVGRGQAARLLFGAGIIDAAEALRIGLVEQVSTSGEGEAEMLAAAIAENAPASLVVLKSMLEEEHIPRKAEFDRCFDDCFDGAAFQEGLAAFRERRKARFA